MLLRSTNQIPGAVSPGESEGGAEFCECGSCASDDMDGRNDAMIYFDEYIGPKGPDYIAKILHVLHASMLKAIGKGNDLHLRLNVAMPVGKDCDR